MAENKIETELLSQIKEVLLTFPKYWEKEVLLRNKVAEDIREYNPELIEALLSNQLVKDTYSITLGSTNIFKIEEFISMLRYKNYWENSYTKYTNEIGLTSEGKYLNYNTDVVLDFPHKDSILEGGMTKEEQGKKEIYYHNVLAKEEIDTLLSPKVFTNMKKYSEKGSYRIKEIEERDNLIVKGNNLVALASLIKRYEGKIKCIYIDPPFNTNNDSFKYNDKFTRSTWLTFMKNRLELAKKLLTHDGSIFIHIDHNQSHYLKVLADEIFGEENFMNEIIWRYRTYVGQVTEYFPRKHDNIYWYKNIERPNFNTTYVGNFEDTPDYKRWSNYLDDKGRIKYGKHPETDSRFNAYLRRYIKQNGNPKIGEVIYENQGYRVDDVWDDIIALDAKNESERIKFFSGSGQKPEALIQRMIGSVTSENDIVLDFFMGSATTQAVAHKMNRQYIGIEQMDYINTVSVPRLQKVIDGEQGGISKDVDWKGGGSFVYAELTSLNDEYVKNIQASKSEEELESVLSSMKESAYLNFKVDLEKVSSKNAGYNNLSLEEKKEVLIQVLDMNQLYLSYSEMEDDQYDIPEDVKAFNHSFYDKEGVKDE